MDLPGDPVVLAEEDGVEGGEHGLLVYADVACKKKDVSKRYDTRWKKKRNAEQRSFFVWKEGSATVLKIMMFVRWRFGRNNGVSRALCGAKRALKFARLKCVENNICYISYRP